MNSQQLMGTNEACRYLEINLAMFRYYLWKKHYLEADQKVGKNLAFSKSTLDAFKARHLSDGYSLQQAATYLGVNLSVLRHHMYVTKLLVADSWRGRTRVFTKETLDAFKTLLPPPLEEPQAQEPIYA